MNTPTLWSHDGEDSIVLVHPATAMVALTIRPQVNRLAPADARQAPTIMQRFVSLQDMWSGAADAYLTAVDGQRVERSH